MEDRRHARKPTGRANNSFVAIISCVKRTGREADMKVNGQHTRTIWVEGDWAVGAGRVKANMLTAINRRDNARFKGFTSFRFNKTEKLTARMNRTSLFR